MKARIVDIENDEVTVKTEHGKFVTVPQKKLKFDCHINQTVVIEKNGDKIYILPEVPSFWGDNDEPIKNKRSKKEKKTRGLTKVLLIALLIVLVVAGGILFLFSKDKMEKDRIANLEKCLSEAQSLAYKESVTKTIECQKNYGGDDKDEKISLNERLLEGANIQQCLEDAENNYAVTEEERVSAGTDLGSSMILVKRYGEKFKAKKACYTKYGKLNDYSSEINKLDADIAENDAMIQYGESAQKSQDIINQSQKYNSLHCTTNSYGSSSYTNCY